MLRIQLRSDHKSMEITRITGKIGAFPFEQPLLIVVCPILMDIDEDWMISRNYLKEEID